MSLDPAVERVLDFGRCPFSSLFFKLLLFYNLTVCYQLKWECGEWINS